MDNQNQSTHELLSQKTVLRVKDFPASKAFYTEVLSLHIVEEYNDGDGSKGCILRYGGEGSNALLEISEIKESHVYYQKAFSKTMGSNKISIQLRTDNVSYWADRLQENWKVRGPVLRPWGSQYLYLLDPDGMQIIIYEEAKN